MAVELREINRANWLQVIRLKVAAGQEKFVASNAFSLAQSKYETEWNTEAIYDDETLVGFIMHGLVEEGDRFDGYWILRLMIAAPFQGKGFGKTSMELILEHIKETGFKGNVFLDFAHGNVVAEKLYTSLGFQDTGEEAGNERIFCLYGQ